MVAHNKGGKSTSCATWKLHVSGGEAKICHAGEGFRTFWKASAATRPNSRTETNPKLGKMRQISVLATRGKGGGGRFDMAPLQKKPKNKSGRDEGEKRVNP